MFFLFYLQIPDIEEEEKKKKHCLPPFRIIPKLSMRNTQKHDR